MNTVSLSEWSSRDPGIPSVFEQFILYLHVCSNIKAHPKKFRLTLPAVSVLDLTYYPIFIFWLSPVRRFCSTIGSRYLCSTHNPTSILDRAYYSAKNPIPWSPHPMESLRVYAIHPPRKFTLDTETTYIHSLVLGDSRYHTWNGT